MKEASWVGVLKLAPGMEMALVRIRGRGEGGWPHLHGDLDLLGHSVDS